MVKKSGNRRSLLVNLILSMNVLFALSLVLALLSPRVSPDKNYIPAFFGLAYPILFYINLIFILIWLLIRKKLAIISVVALLSGFSMAPKYFQWNSARKKNPDIIEKLTVVSYNIQSFRTFYNHESQSYLDSLKVFLQTLNPDIL